MAAKVREAAGTVERILLPRLNSIDGELKSINTRMDSIDGKIGSLRNEMSSEIGSVQKEMGSTRNELLANMARVEQKVDSLAGRFDLVKDMERLKMKVAELEKRR
jgi:archaellum component FlaC